MDFVCVQGVKDSESKELIKSGFAAKFPASQGKDQSTQNLKVTIQIPHLSMRVFQVEGY